MKLMLGYKRNLAASACRYENTNEVCNLFFTLVRGPSIDYHFTYSGGKRMG